MNAPNHSVKRINDKVKRTVKYWRVRYQQANDRERLNLYLITFTLLTYVWWMITVL
jgi:hypothetical protein